MRGEGGIRGKGFRNTERGVGDCVMFALAEYQMIGTRRGTFIFANMSQNEHDDDGQCRTMTTTDNYNRQ